MNKPEEAGVSKVFEESVSILVVRSLVEDRVNETARLTFATVGGGSTEERNDSGGGRATREGKRGGSKFVAKMKLPHRESSALYEFAAEKGREQAGADEREERRGWRCDKESRRLSSLPCPPLGLNK